MITLHKQNATLLSLFCCHPLFFLSSPSSLNSLFLSSLPPLSQFLSVPVPVRDIWPAPQPGATNTLFRLVIKGLHVCPCFLRVSEGPIGRGVTRREGAVAQFWKRERKNEGALRSEVESE